MKRIAFEDDMISRDSDQLDECGSLYGLVLHHDLSLRLPDWDRWSAIEQDVRAMGAHFRSLQMTKRDDGVFIRCRVDSITSQAARTLAQRLREIQQVESVGHEHILLAPSKLQS